MVVHPEQEAGLASSLLLAPEMLRPRMGAVVQGLLREPPSSNPPLLDETHLESHSSVTGDAINCPEYCAAACVRAGFKAQVSRTKLTRYTCRNKPHKARITVDLHGLHVSEAIRKVEKVLDDLQGTLSGMLRHTPCLVDF